MGIIEMRDISLNNLVKKCREKESLGFEYVSKIIKDEVISYSYIYKYKKRYCEKEIITTYKVTMTDNENTCNTIKKCRSGHIEKRLKQKEDCENNKVLIIESIKKLNEEKTFPLSVNYIKKNHYNLYIKAKKYFKSCEKAIQKAISFEDTYWMKEDVVNEIKRLHGMSVDMHHTNIYKNYSYILYRSLNFFDNWYEATKEAGIKVSNNQRISVSAGRLFEKMVDNLLNELNLKYEKYKHHKYRPDYVFDNFKWGDAKLSEWTISSNSCKTIERYEPYCKNLLIIYMRGNKDRDEMITEKTRIMSVHKLIKQLPKNRQKIYFQEIDRITTILSSEDTEEFINDKEKVILKIKDIYKTNKKLNPTYVLQNFPSLYTSCRRYFGSYKNAVESSGIDYQELLMRKVS